MQVHAARIERCSRAQGRIQIHHRERGRAQATDLHVDHVINCTGLDYDLRRIRDPLWRTLLDADGWPGPHLYYLGPLLRADHWEATAAAELRLHAEQLASTLMNGERIEGNNLRRTAP